MGSPTHALARGLLVGTLLLGAGSGFAQETDPRLSADLRFLASPLLEERSVGSRGALVTAAYLSAALEGAGLDGLWGNGVFEQPTTVRRSATEGTMVVGFGPRTVNLRAPADLRANARAGQLSVDGPLVFVGYGMVAPHRGRNDLGAGSLDGSIAVVLDGDRAAAPEDAPTIRDGVDALPDSKLRRLAGLGTRGVLIVIDDISTVALDPVGSGAAELPRGLAFAAWITRSAMAELLATADRDLAVLERRAAQPGFAPLSLGGHLVADLTTTFDLVTMPSVGARSPGTTSPDAGSILVLTHYDETPGARGHNAQSLGAFLALACRFASMPERGGRPVVFLATPGAHGSYARGAVLRDAHSAVVLDHVGVASAGDRQGLWGGAGSSLDSVLVGTGPVGGDPSEWMMLGPQWLDAGRAGVASVVVGGGAGAKTSVDLAGGVIEILREMQGRPVLRVAIP
jgi:hypothetical protein